jgi:flagellar biosynthetic protein FliR
VDFLAVERLGLLLVRPGVLVMASPAFGGVYAPAFVKIGLTVILAIVLSPLVSLPAIAPGALPLFAMREAVIGLALAMAVRVLIAGAEFGGHLIGFQIGFSYAAIVDPQSGVRNNLLAALHGMMAVVTFLSIDGHHALIRTLAASYQSMPAGPGHVDGSLVGTVTQMLGAIFTLGAHLAAPVVVALVLVELALGIISRSAPALNLMVVGFPIRLIAGLVALAAGLRVGPPLMRGVGALALDLSARLALAFR